MKICNPTPTGTVELAEYDAAFLEHSWRWLNDPVIKKLTMTPDFSREGQQQWFQSLPGKTDYLIFGITLAKRPIGACGLKNITASDAEYWGYIGESEFWGMGLGRQLLSAMFDLGRRRGLVSLWLKVAADNRRAIRLYEHCGFVAVSAQEGVLVMSAPIAPVSEQ